MSASVTPPLLDDLLRRETTYAANTYLGVDAPNAVRLVRTGASGVLVTAPHAVTHRREGRDKRAERWTGALAELLAERCDGAALCVTGPQTGDANWDGSDDSPFHTTLRAALPATTLLLDLHGMRDDYGIDICCGLGPHPQPLTRRLAHRLAEACATADLRYAFNVPFDASRATTVTAIAQQAGVAAVQVELSARARDPHGDLRLVEHALTVLATTVLAALPNAPVHD